MGWIFQGFGFQSCVFCPPSKKRSRRFNSNVSAKGGRGVAGLRMNIVFLCECGKDSLDLVFQCGNGLDSKADLGEGSRD